MVEIKTGKPLGMFAVLAFALLLLAGFASASVNPKVQLLNYSISETPVQPGHVLVLTLHMKSMETDNCAERVAVQLAVSYPLSVRGSDTQYVNLLCSQDPEARGTFTFYLPVDNLATSGTYQVSVSTTYEKRYTKLSEANTLNIQVGGAPSFVASVVSSSPVDIYPGDSAQVTVSFQNTGPSMVTAARASATATAPRGIIVKWAGQTQDIGQIASHGSATATFAVEAPKNIQSGSYPLTVRLDYTGEDSVSGNKEFTFDVPVKPKADFVAAMASDDLLPGQKRQVNVAITNTGSQEARKVEVRIKPLFPFSTDGTVRYIEKLAPGETQNLTYVITVDKDATSGGQLIGVLIDFEDPQGKKMSDTADFSMPVRMPTLVEEIVGYWYVIAILVVACAFALMKRKGAAAKKA